MIGKSVKIIDPDLKPLTDRHGETGTITRLIHENYQGKGSYWTIVFGVDQYSYNILSRQFVPLPEERFPCPFCGATVAVKNLRLADHHHDSVSLCGGSYIPVEMRWKDS
jgi:hypothetical protein